MISEAERIAGELTEAQRRSVLLEREPNGRGKWPARSALLNKGLARSWPWKLTPLGLEVKRILEEKE